MKQKVLAAILFVCVTIGVIGSPVAAAVDDEYGWTGVQVPVMADLEVMPGYIEIAPLWEIISTLRLDMSFNNGVITSNGSVSGRAGTTSISATYTLERQQANGTFQRVDSWSANSNSMILTSSRTTSNMIRGTYRLSVTVTATRNGVVETASETLTRTF